MDKMEFDRETERKRLKRKCRSLLDNEKVKVYRSRAEFDQAVTNLDMFSGKVRRMIQLQVRLLVQRYNLKRHQLMAFSSKATGLFDNDVVVERYQHDVLDKISNNELKLQGKSLSAQLTKKMHVFRGGEIYENDTTYIDNIIKEVRYGRVCDRWISLMTKLISSKDKKGYVYDLYSIDMDFYHP